MRLWICRGYWRRSAPGKRGLMLYELVVTTSDDEARDLAARRWRDVYATLDGEPVVSSVREVTDVDGYGVRVEGV